MDGQSLQAVGCPSTKLSSLKACSWRNWRNPAKDCIVWASLQHLNLVLIFLMKKTTFYLRCRYKCIHPSRTHFCSWLSLYIGRTLNPHTKPMLMCPDSGDKIMVVFPAGTEPMAETVADGLVLAVLNKINSLEYLKLFFCPLFANLGNTWTKTPDLKINICAPGVMCSAEASSIAWYVLSKRWRQPLGKTGHKLCLTRVPCSGLHRNPLPKASPSQVEEGDKEKSQNTWLTQCCESKSFCWIIYLPPILQKDKRMN